MPVSHKTLEIYTSNLIIGLKRKMSHSYLQRCEGYSRAVQAEAAGHTPCFGNTFWLWVTIISITVAFSSIYAAPTEEYSPQNQRHPCTFAWGLHFPSFLHWEENRNEHKKAWQDKKPPAKGGATAGTKLVSGMLKGLALNYHSAGKGVEFQISLNKN